MVVAWDLAGKTAITASFWTLGRKSTTDYVSLIGREVLDARGSVLSCWRDLGSDWVVACDCYVLGWVVQHLELFVVVSDFSGTSAPALSSWSVDFFCWRLLGGGPCFFVGIAIMG